MMFVRFGLFDQGIVEHVGASQWGGLSDLTEYEMDGREAHGGRRRARR